MIDNPRKDFYGWLKQRQNFPLKKGQSSVRVQKRRARVAELRDLGLHDDLIAAELGITLGTVVYDVTNLIKKKRLKPFPLTHNEIQKRKQVRAAYLAGGLDRVRDLRAVSSNLALSVDNVAVDGDRSGLDLHGPAAEATRPPGESANREAA